jgi:hypothetical protein
VKEIRMTEPTTARTPDTLFEIEEKPPALAAGLRKAELVELVEKMQRDWVQLNAFLNATAKYYSWCSDYEGRLRRYNKDMRVLKLEGRPDFDPINYRSGDPFLLPEGELKRLKIKDVQFE